MENVAYTSCIFETNSFIKILFKLLTTKVGKIIKNKSDSFNIINITCLLYTSEFVDGQPDHVLLEIVVAGVMQREVLPDLRCVRVQDVYKRQGGIQKTSGAIH